MLNFTPEIRAILEEDDFSEGILKILSVEFLNDDIQLKLELFNEYRRIPHQIWTVLCKEYLSHRFASSGMPESVTILHDHPLLFPYNNEYADLYFNGSTKQEKELLAELLSAHRSVVGHYFPIEEFTNQLPYLSKEFNYGLFAKGPKNLLEAYADTLKKYNIECSLINCKTVASRWIHQDEPYGGRWVANDGDNIIFCIGEGNYIITKHIEITSEILK